MKEEQRDLTGEWIQCAQKEGDARDPCPECGTPNWWPECPECGWWETNYISNQRADEARES